MKTAHLAGPSGPRAVVSHAEAGAPGADLLDAFVSESKAPAPKTPDKPAWTAPSAAGILRNPRLKAAIKWVCVVAATAAATLGGLWAFQQRAVQPLPATLTLQT